MNKIEQYTEELTRTMMGFNLGENEFGYVYPQGNIPSITKIQTALKSAGGKPLDCHLNDYTQGGNGNAKPEFIITFKDDANTILVIECKSKTAHHETKELYNKPRKCAVDGALYYAKFLKDDYNIIAIGISGTDEKKAQLDVFYWTKGQEKPQHQQKLHNIFLTPANYLKAIKGEKITKAYSLDEIRATALDFHDKLRISGITERQKPIFIAGILIALEDNDFLKSYINLPSFSSIIIQLNAAIEYVLNKSDIKKTNLDNIKQHFISIGTNQKLNEISLDKDGSIRWYIEQLEMKIKPMMNNAEYSLDALGVFYHEFVRYSGGDGSGLGIVLTPQHLTDFMCDLAQINQNSRVVDICCGSGSFLVTAMNKMFNDAASIDKKKEIRENNLYGIEDKEDLYILSIANMIVRKDGKSNIIQGDCFNVATVKKLKELSKNKEEGKPNIDVGLLNPPYSQKDKSELEFVEQLLSVIDFGGKAVVVVPMSCAIGTKFKEERKRLFEKHTLKAVFSMPNDVFYPTGTNVCVMVWEAHKPHNSIIKTFFGYYKEDGFVKRKKLGRVDALNKWESIKLEWLSLYFNSEEQVGLTAKQSVEYNDEWLCEAYMKTDYSKLCLDNFKKTIRVYFSYLVFNGITDLSIKFTENKQKTFTLNDRKWKKFDLYEFFTPKRGTRLKQEDRIEGTIPLVTAGESNLGVKEFISNAQDVFESKITIDMFCNTYVHMDKFSCDDNIITLDCKVNINLYIMLFVSTIIYLDKYRYQYGRQYRIKNFLNHKIELPVNNEESPDWKFMEDFIKQLPYADRI